MFDDECSSVGQKCFCHSITISISLEFLDQSSPFCYHCLKGKSMTYLEMNIIFFKISLLFKIIAPSNDITFCFKGSQLAKIKSIFLLFPWHKIYGECVGGLSLSNYT